ncbi:MAG TPA: DNA polymerase I [Syntrophomonadaceae bacterium]|nr:DNA polymerase I [Syntrophomonadaceae bacterium]
MEKEKLMLIDGNSLLFRAFYALPLLHTSSGIYTNGVYGFFTMFNRVLAQEQPTYVVVAFDKDRKTFRSESYEHYKANRSQPPEELRGQFDLLRQVLTARGIKWIEAPGFEADDIIGTLSKKAEQQGITTVIVTGDGDSLQLVSPDIRVLMTRKGISEIEVYDPEKVKEKWEVEPEKMIEIKALMGDSSDNIPGVPGIGPKTAVKLVKEFDNLENLYASLDKVGNVKLRSKLEEFKDQAFLSRHLATIVNDMDLDCSLEEFILQAEDYPALVQLYKLLEFNAWLNALTQVDPLHTPQALEDPEVYFLNDADQVYAFRQEVDGKSLGLYFACDYHHPMWAHLKAVYMAREGKVYCLSLDQEPVTRLEWLRPLLESETTSKYVHNAKFAQVLLINHGMQLAGVSGDTLLLAYVNDPSFVGDELNAVLLKHLDIHIKKDRPDLLVSQLETAFHHMQGEIEEDLLNLLCDLEMPLSDILAHMEFYGIKVEKSTLAAISTELGQGIARDEERIYELAGHAFNINSPRQLGQVLFEDLGLKVVKKTKTGYATGAEILEELYDEHEIIRYILDYRQLAKLKSTYVDALQGLIHPDTGRVHTIFKQAQTATGRLSSVEPNLQNIPIKMEEGRRIRKAFVSGFEDWLLVSADYSQIDLRALAHISGDETLIETFNQGIDIHTRTAAEIFHVSLEGVTGELRRRAKAINFGIIYGMSDFGLARETGVSRKEARIYIDNYLDSYPGVRQYMHDIVEFGKEYGYVETVLKRRRYLPDLNAKNRMVQANAQRMALNTPIQGTSADIIKLAMIKVHQDLQEKGLRARMLLQVHDELVMEVPIEELTEVAVLLKEDMETAFQMKVPLVVSLKTGANWYDMQAMKM